MWIMQNFYIIKLQWDSICFQQYSISSTAEIKKIKCDQIYTVLWKKPEMLNFGFAFWAKLFLSGLYWV